jgi:hypothetical protein
LILKNVIQVRKDNTRPLRDVKLSFLGRVETAFMGRKTVEAFEYRLFINAESKEEGKSGGA